MKQNYQADFQKTFDLLCRTRSRNTVWNDFLTVSAVSIANACDFREGRETMACKILEKYTKEEQRQLSSLLANVVLALDADPKQDYLGGLCHKFFLNNKYLGQNFTPYHIAEFMIRCTCDNKLQEPYMSINDPACGYGVMFIAARNFCIENGKSPHTNLFCVAQDIDFCAAMGCYIQMSLLGIAGYVRVGDSLSSPPTGNVLIPEEAVWCTPMYFLPEWKIRRLFFY